MTEPPRNPNFSYDFPLYLNRKVHLGFLRIPGHMTSEEYVLFKGQVDAAMGIVASFVEIEKENDDMCEPPDVPFYKPVLDESPEETLKRINADEEKDDV